MMPTDDRYIATTLTTAAHQRLRAFKSLVLKAGYGRLPDGLAPTGALTLSSTIELALALAERAIKGKMK
jgi:hypothetical protein